MNPALDLILSKLSGVKETKPGQWVALCPVHGDVKTPDLYIKQGDVQDVVMKCQAAGCSFEQVKDVLGITNRDLYPDPPMKNGNADYPTRDQYGSKHAIHRRRMKDGKKDIKWAGPNGKLGLKVSVSALPLYRSELMGDWNEQPFVVLAEGEKATDALVREGYAALGTVTGAANVPSRDSFRILSGRTVICWPDNDDEGLNHMRRCAGILHRLGADVRWFEWSEAPEKGDAADHPDLAGLLHDFELLERWHPDPTMDGARDTADLHRRFVQYLDRRDDNAGITGIRSGLDKLDRELEGFNRGHSYVIAASTGIGKSLFCAQVALTAALNGHRVLLATPEMADLEIHKRMVFYLAGVNYFAWKQKIKTAPEDKKRLIEASRRITELPYFYNPKGDQAVEDVAQDIEDWEPELVVVDYVQYLEGPGQTEYEQVSAVAKDTNKLKESYDLPIIIAAQLNRNLAYRPKDKPQLSDIRASGKIEQGADVVLMLHRPEKGNGEVQQGNEEIELLCPKNRTGQDFDMDLWFVPGQNWLTDKVRITR